MHPADRERIEAAGEYINQHFTKEITLAKLAAHCGLQPTKLKRLFKLHYFGLTPDQYRFTLRMEAAKCLLLDGYQVKEIAELLGYANAANFSNSFITYTGQRPTNF